MKKCIVMLSGGLDSRLALKIMQEKGFEVLSLFFKLPFGTGCCDENCSFNFSQLHGARLKIFDCTKGELLQEYLDVIKKAQHGTGAGVNPCIDCRIFMLKKAKEFADKKGIKIIVTGEVLNERPMSQTGKAMKIVEEESGLGDRLVRPLCELGIQGRSRQKQIALAKKFKITYPNPAGGCLLCEKFLKKRFNFILERGINEIEIKLIGIGRHFVIDNTWIILGKDKKENEIIEIIGSKIGELIVPEVAGPTALIMDKCDEKIRGNQGRIPKKGTRTCKQAPKNIQKNISTRGNIKELIKAYSGKDLEERKKFEEWKL
jgi:hypothetical protein